MDPGDDELGERKVIVMDSLAEYDRIGMGCSSTVLQCVWNGIRSHSGAVCFSGDV